MLDIKVNINIDNIEAYLNGLSARMREPAVAAALNKTAAKARTEMKRRISGEYNVSQRDVNAQLSIDKASYKSGKMTASLTAFGKRRGHRSRNVMLFDAREVKGNGPVKRVNVQFPGGEWRSIYVRSGGGVSIKIKRNGGRKLIKDAFIANQGRTVFIRTPDNKIKAVETIDIPQMFNTKSINKAVTDRIVDDFKVEFDRAWRHFSSRA